MYDADGCEAPCAGGQSSRVATVHVDGRDVDIIALEPILELAYRRGLRAGGDLPEEIRQAVYVFNGVPPADEELYERAALAAWEAFCCAQDA
jgi:hypothetical protein